MSPQVWDTHSVEIVTSGRLERQIGGIIVSQTMNIVHHSSHTGTFVAYRRGGSESLLDVLSSCTLAVFGCPFTVSDRWLAADLHPLDPNYRADRVRVGTQRGLRGPRARDMINTCRRDRAS